MIFHMLLRSLLYGHCIWRSQQSTNGRGQKITVTLLAVLSKYEEKQHLPIFGEMSSNKISEASTLQSKCSSLRSRLEHLIF